MASIFEEARQLKARKQKASLSTPVEGPLSVDISKEELKKEEPPQVKLTAQDLKKISAPIVKGDFAKALAPHVATGPKSIMEDALDIKEEKIKGYKPASPMVVSDPEAAKFIKSKPQSIFDMAKDIKSSKVKPLQTGIEETKEGTDFTSELKKGFESQDSKLKPFVTALSIDEHLIVRTLSKGLGLKNKDDISDYTWTNFLKEMYPKASPGSSEGQKVADNALMDGLGIGLSIVASPSTYLTFGTSKAAKIGLQTSLSKKGMKLVNETAKDLAESRIVAEAVKNGGGVSQGLQNSIRQDAKFEVEQQLLKRFGEINSYNKNLDIAESVAKLPSDVISKGGTRLVVGQKEIKGPLKALDKAAEGVGKLYEAAKIKFFGESVLSGDEVAKIALDAKLDKTAKILDEIDKISDVEKGGGFKLPTPGVLQKVGEFAKSTKDFFGEKFVYLYGVDKKLLDYMRRAGPNAERLLENPGIALKDRSHLEIAYNIAKLEQFQTEARVLADYSFKVGNKLFAGLGAPQQKEFMDTLIEASTKSERKVGLAKEVTKLKGGDVEKVGKEAFSIEKAKQILAPSKDPKVQQAIDSWLGQGAYKGKGIADKLGDKLGLLESTSIPPIWVPGVIEEFGKKIKFSLPTEEASRDFLKSRIDYGSLSESYSRRANFAIGHRLALIAHSDLQEKFFENMVKLRLGDAKPVGRFANDYEALKSGYLPIRKPIFKADASGGDTLKAFTEAEKFYVKKEFAQTYNRLVKESTLNVPLLTASTQLFKQHATGVHPAFHVRNMNSTIVQNALTIGAINTVKGNVMHFIRGTVKHGEKFVGPLKSDIGEVLTSKQLIQEAKKEGVLDGGHYVADVAGDTLPKVLGEGWKTALYRLGAFWSPDWTPSVVGTKLGKAIENQARMVNYTYWRSKGLSPRLAAIEAGEALIDYNKVTSFEKGLNSTFIPFYTFRKANFINHVKLMAHKPGKITALSKLYRELAPDDETLQAMPEWARKKFIVKVKENFYSGFGIPLEDAVEVASMAGDPVDEVIKSLTPYLRYGVERGLTKVDTFSKRDIDKVNNANEFVFLLNIVENPNIPEAFKASARKSVQFLKLERDPGNPDKAIADGNILHILRSSFTSRYQSMWGQLQKEEQTTALKTLRALTGIIQLEPDDQKESSFYGQKVGKEMAGLIQKTNLAKELPVRVYVTGKTSESKRRAKIANEFFEKLNDLQKRKASIEQKRALKEEYDEKIREDQEFRVSQ